MIDDILKWDAFFFDFDGVLADSVEVKTRAFGKLFEPFGPNIVDKVVTHHRHHGGMTRMDKFKLYYSTFLKKPLSDKELSDLCQRFADLVVDEVVASPEIPGAENYLKACCSTSICFVISATPENEIIEIVKRRNWDRYFKEVLGAPANKTENTLKLLRKYSLAPQKCIFFGDAESDYLAAMDCRMYFLAILPGEEAPLLKIAPDIEWHRDFYEVAQRLSYINT
jgi:beta-phosphoglucomutase-like phosphatase (HAD superfamily)